MSGSEVAYHLRVNKHIDRQLFIESLDLVNIAFPVSNYGYVSMAGAYLEDCRVIHQYTRISKMLSFDSNPHVLERQVVNRPYGFVQTVEATSSEMVSDTSRIRSEFGDENINLVFWLDFTDPGERRSQLQELSTLVSKVFPGDIIRVTMNAHRTTLGENKDFVNLPPDFRPETLSDWRHLNLKEQVGPEYLPADRDDPKYLDNNDEFCRTIIGAIRHAIIGALEPRSELIAFPILSTAYGDTHNMVSVACLILDTLRVDEFKSRVRWDPDWPYKPGDNWDEFVSIRVPHLSVQERMVIHQYLESGGIFREENLPFVSVGDLEQYQKHYSRYPTFVPLDII